MTHPIDWWLGRLNNVRPVGKGYTALCPVHGDTENSLSIRETPDGSGVLVHCFRECDYKEIVTILERNGAAPLDESVRAVLKGQTARAFWEEYTAVPSVFWEGLGLSFSKESVAFTWGEETPSQKERHFHRQGKGFSWAPEGAPRPPLWPRVPDKLPKRIWIAEGESDCGILRFIGLEAFGLTKGAGWIKDSQDVWETLHKRGVSEIVFVLDFDEEGLKRLKFLSRAHVEGVEFFGVDLSGIVNHLLGEKDIRDVWRRPLYPEELKQKLESATQPLTSRVLNRISLIEFLSKPLREMTWSVENILMTKTVELIVGLPKIGKSWLALDMGVSVATGLPFLDHFPVVNPGPVLYLTKEDPEYSLQDRLAKVVISKGLGGSVEREDGLLTLQPPHTRSVPFYVDLQRGFLFSPEHVNELIEWLSVLRDSLGSIALVVFDPILRMMPTGLDEYRATDVNTAIFEPAAQIVEEVGASILLVHHRGKTFSSAKGSYGSIGFHAFSDGTHYLTKQDDEWVKVISEFKSAPERHWSFGLRNLEEGYEAEVIEGKVSTLGRASSLLQGDILNHLKLHPEGKLVTQIDSAFKDVEMARIREQLKDLEKQGLVYRRKVRTREPGAKGGPRPDRWFAKEEENEILTSTS